MEIARESKTVALMQASQGAEKTIMRRWIVETKPHPSRTAAEAMVFSSVDTKQSHPQGHRIYAIVNDDKPHSVSETQLDAMREHEVHPVQWTKRDQARQEFAA